jgi:hypothetical protein
MNKAVVSADKVFDVLRLIKTPTYKLKTNGEIRTDPALVDEILNGIPESVWVNGGVFLDPCCGRGTFLLKIIDRLAQHHSKQDIVHMIKGIDFDGHCVYTSKEVVARRLDVSTDDLDTVIVKDNFLTWDTKNMRPDVIVGNPPYQNNHKKDDEAKRKVGNKLWYQFIFKADNMVKPDGYVAMVSPNQWLTGGVNMRKGELGVLKDVFAKKQLITATVSGITEKYFKGIGISIGWWVYKNAPITQDTTLVLNTSTIAVNFQGLEFLSPVADELSIGVVTKTLLAKNPKFTTYYFNSQASPGANNETEEPNATHTIPHWIMGSATTGNLIVRYFDKKLNEKVGYKKILFPMSTRYWQPHLAEADVCVASLGQALQVDANTTQDGFESVFYSKLFKYLCFNLQIAQNGFMKTVLVKALPKLDMSKVWSDKDLYKHFKLSKEEIAYVESNVG